MNKEQFKKKLKYGNRYCVKHDAFTYRAWSGPKDCVVYACNECAPPIDVSAESITIVLDETYE